MNKVIEALNIEMQAAKLSFAKKPILIGGMAMEYYGMRKSGADIDLVICDEDYQALASAAPDQRKDIYGDLGVLVGRFEIWRSIALLDYDFYLKNAVEEQQVFVVSLDRLMFMRVIAMEVEKYRDDLELMTQYYYGNFRNRSFETEAYTHVPSYDKNQGIVFGGNYEDDAT